MRLSETQFDAATALWQGAREHQEDAVVADFPLGAETGALVLSDGMGGHAAGDVASRIVMTEVFSELALRTGGTPPDALLRGAALGANACLRAHVAEHPSARGMGATLVAAVIAAGRLHWISIGDSVLFLFRDGCLVQLNEDHSMAPKLDFMASSGLIDRDAARAHPDRNALLSVLSGNRVARIDCPHDGVALRDGDILLAASDGLLHLEPRRIERVLADGRVQPAFGLVRLLLHEIAVLDDPEQDNTALAVVKVQMAGSAAPAEPLRDTRRGGVALAAAG